MPALGDAACGAAAVAAIIGGVWWSGQDDTSGLTPPAHTGPSVVPSETATDLPTTAPSSPPSTATSSATGGSVTTRQVSLPVYFVGPIGDAKPTYKLFREFIRDDLPSDASPAEKAKAALVLAINAQPYSNTDGYLQPWSGQTIGDVTVKDGLITIDLANAGNPDAAVSRRTSASPCRSWSGPRRPRSSRPSRCGSRSRARRPSCSARSRRTRPSPVRRRTRLWQDVAPIWITSPGRDQVLPAAKPVVVQGLGDHLRGHRQLGSSSAGPPGSRPATRSARSGRPCRASTRSTSASSPPAATRSSFAQLSAKDGSVSAEKSVSFSVK